MSGQRVSRQTVKEEIPEDFQRAEFQFRHGMLDAIVARGQMRATLARLLAMLHRPRAVAAKKAPAKKITRH